MLLAEETLKTELLVRPDRLTFIVWGANPVTDVAKLPTPWMRMFPELSGVASVELFPESVKTPVEGGIVAAMEIEFVPGVIVILDPASIEKLWPESGDIVLIV